MPREGEATANINYPGVWGVQVCDYTTHPIHPDK
jgi:hypothetical protein